jgi:hypothetical protein
VEDELSTTSSSSSSSLSSAPSTTTFEGSKLRAAGLHLSEENKNFLQQLGFKLKHVESKK